MNGERSQKREAVRGGLALGILVLLFLAVFFAADVRRMLTPSDDLYVLMPSAAGLRSGSLVWIAGQTVGEVQDIDVRPPGSDSLERVLVRVEVEHRHLEHIRADSEVRVTSFRVIGDPVLDITPGDPALPAIAPGDTLRFRASASPEAALRRAVSLQESLEQLLAETREVSAHAQDRSAQAARVGRQLAVSARELRAFIVSVQEGALNRLTEPEFQEVITRLGETVDDVRNSFAGASQRARAARAEVAPVLERLTARADTISAAIAQLQQAVNAEGGGLLVRAQRDSAIVKALHGAQAQLDSLVAETRRNPLRFWF